ncbi:MAG TPA: MarR family transcriptional regulator [Gemmatimonadaceae bacterium]|nr:MarR family transcriptional regulator [Gemmatimonadaceae bacterium]
MTKRARVKREYLRPDEFSAWQGILVTSARVLRALDEGLCAEHGISVAEFDVLITLANASRRRLRMSELARSVALSPAGLTHLVTRLERERLVAREVDADDRRGFHTVLTDAGEDRLDASRPLHNRIIRELLLDRMTAHDQRQLGAIWKRVEAAAPAAPDKIKQAAARAGRRPAARVSGKRDQTAVDAIGGR